MPSDINYNSDAGTTNSASIENQTKKRGRKIKYLTDEDRNEAIRVSKRKYQRNNKELFIKHLKKYRATDVGKERNRACVREHRIRKANEKQKIENTDQ